MNKMEGQWTEIAVAGHRCEAYRPAGPSPHPSTVLYLHDEDLGRFSDHPLLTGLLERHGLSCLAPATGRSWWTDRVFAEFDPSVSAERHLLERVLPWLAEHWSVRPPQIALLGVGMGGQGALRLSYKHPNIFPVCAAISPTIDYQLLMEEGDEGLAQLYRDPEQARQDTATLHIHPLNWPRHQWFCCDPADYRWHESADRLRMKLYSLGVPYEADLETTGGGHSWDYYEKMAGPALHFIADRLERERMRVV